MTRTESDILVIGGGLHGLSVALQLLRAGRSVTILEESWVGRHASGASAAGVRTMFRPVSELPVSVEAAGMWHRIEDLVGDTCGFHANGQLRVAERDTDLISLENRVRETRSAGFKHEEMIDRQTLRRLAPAIAPHCVGALYVCTDGAADPHRTLRAFRVAVLAAGGLICEGTSVTGADHNDTGWKLLCGDRIFRAPVVVNAAGAWAGKIAAMLGDDIPLGVKASMMMVTERVAPFLDPVVSAVGRTLSFKQSEQGTLVIGGGLQGRADVEAQRSFVDFERLARGARAATELFPAVRNIRIVRTWAGIEATTSDHQPVIGASTRSPGVFHVFGFSGHGFQLVPVTGLILRDLIIDTKTSRQIASFAPDRLGVRSAA
ncbi:FAD-dependent oxidoreductase [Cereibacter sp. SYSU M97828]|nr:FAD-dependent oxidoreductase [Cereibacter flavus]